MAHCIPTSIDNDGKVEEKRGHERGHERQAMRNCKKCCTQREMKDNDFFNLYNFDDNFLEIKSTGRHWIRQINLQNF